MPISLKKNVCRILFITFLILISANLVFAIDIYQPSCTSCRFVYPWAESQFIVNDNTIMGNLTSAFTISIEDIKMGRLKDNLTIVSREGKLEINQLNITLNSVEIKIDSNKISDREYKIALPENIIELFPQSEFSMYNFKIKLEYELSDFANELAYGRFSFTSRSMCPGGCNQQKIILLSTDKYGVESFSNLENCFKQVAPNIDCFSI